jgi:S-disulfanyl-L-cysteine oxidoreductase SoxD
MCKFKGCAAAGALWLTTLNVLATTPWHALGDAATPSAVASWDIDVRPDGKGLLAGAGSVAAGQAIYEAQCANCHGVFGESTEYIALTGGIGSLASDAPQRTVGSKLDYATTLWDYINRAMPFANSKTLTVDEVYAVTAYVLNLNDIVPADAVLDQHSLPQIDMPNRAGFTRDHGMTSVTGVPDVQNTACMQDCSAEQPAVASELPADFTQQMYGDIRTHFRQFAAAASSPPKSDQTASEGRKLAEVHGCLTCHALDKAHVGPALVEIGLRYASDAAALQTLAGKVRQGGSGVWGSAVMPPQTQLSSADLARILAWILDGAGRSTN